MKRYTFIDIICQKAYDTQVADNEALGGSESSLVRIADELSYHNNVKVFNKRLTIDRHYYPLYQLKDEKSLGTVIHFRTPMTIPFTKKQDISAHHILWLMDLPTRDFVIECGAALDTTVKVVCLSEFHKLRVIQALRAAYKIEELEKWTFQVIPLPVIVDTEKYKNIQHDPYKLCFFSSPIKGLDSTLELFSCLYQSEPKYRLYVAAPDYLPIPELKHPGVVKLGHLPKDSVHKHVAESLCMLYGNKSFPETFGLVFAEANALGTPVLTYGIGADNEVLDNNPLQFIPRYDKFKFVERIHKFTSGERPSVKMYDKFLLENVIKQWNRL